VCCSGLGLGLWVHCKGETAERLVWLVLGVFRFRRTNTECSLASANASSLRSRVLLCETIRTNTNTGGESGGLVWTSDEAIASDHILGLYYCILR
jgi:hypothetical protein